MSEEKMQPPRIGVELSLRIVLDARETRGLKDASRKILARLEQAHIEVASTPFAIVGVPPLRIERAALRAEWHRG